MPELNDLLPMLGLIAVIGAFAGLIAGFWAWAAASSSCPPSSSLSSGWATPRRT
jgi:hypothetical protein